MSAGGRTIRAGSWARVPSTRVWDLHSFTVAAMIWPTPPGRVGRA